MKFVEFINERMSIYFRRLLGIEPWTTHPVFLHGRFTNVYRVLDRTTQYLINHVQNGSWTDVVYKTYLFKTFNKIETWKRLEAQFGEITWIESRFHADWLNMQDRLWSGAYMMTGSDMVSPKSQYYLAEIGRQMDSGLADKLAQARSLRELYEVFLRCKYISHFLAYQYATDINYMIQFPEDTFCVLGPGSRRGLLYTYGDEDIKHIWDLYEQGYSFFRKLQPIDIQNCFCEISKAVAKRQRRKYSRGEPIDSPVFPETWGVDFDGYLSSNREAIQQNGISARVG